MSFSVAPIIRHAASPHVSTPEKEQGKFDTLFSANEYLEGLELSADRLLEAYDSRESEVARIESVALDRRHPVEIRLLEELVSIGIRRPELQDRILDGETITFSLGAWRDPSNGKEIPEEFYQEVDVRLENRGKDSFISM